MRSYWGRESPEIPSEFRDWDGLDVSLGGRGHRCNFPDEFVARFVHWLEAVGMTGYVGEPEDW